MDSNESDATFANSILEHQRLKALFNREDIHGLPMVFDIRGTEMPIQGKRVHGKDYISSICDYTYVQIYDVPKEWVHIKQNGHTVVISEKPNYIFFSDVNNDDKRLLNPKHTFCIGICSTTTIGELIDCMSRKDVDSHRDVSFISKGKLLDHDLIISAHFGNGAHLVYVVHAKKTVDCFHLDRPGVENRYTIPCFNISNIGEIKEIFRRTFSTDIRGLASGKDVVWFTRGKHLFGDNEYPFLIPRSKHGYLNKEHQRLFVQIKPVNSFSVILKFIPPTNENSSQNLLVNLPLTTEQLRQKVSLYMTCPTSAIELSVNNKTLKETSLSKRNGFIANCSIQVKTTDPIMIYMDIQGKERKRMQKDIYRFDRVNILKDSLSDQHASRDLKLTFNGEEMQDECLLLDYHIQNEDVIEVHVLPDPIHLHVRHPGHPPYTLTVCNHRTVTVLQVRKHLAREFCTSTGELNIIYRQRCLDDNTTLHDNGLTSDCTILLPRVTRRTRKHDDIIKTVYVCNPDSTLTSQLAIQAAGIMFYAPEEVKAVMLQTSEADDSSHHEIRIRYVKDTMHSSASSQRQGEQDTTPIATSTKSKGEHQNLRLPVATKQNQNATESAPLNQAVVNGTASMQSRHNYRNRHASIVHSRSQPVLSGYTSEPGPPLSVMKTFSYTKSLTQDSNRVVLQEMAWCEADVSSKEADDIFCSSPLSQQLQSCEIQSPSPEKNVCTSSVYLHPSEAVQTSVLEVVSSKLGNEWKRLAINLGLESNDLEMIEHRHPRSLHDQAFDALKLWKTRQSKHATIEQLKAGLRQCELNIIADSITDDVKYEIT